MAREVSARWDGGMSTTVTFGDVELAVGEDVVLANGLPGPYPTHVLLGAVASCFTLAMVWVAAKRELTLPGLRVDVGAESDGPRLSGISIEVHADADPDLVEMLLPRAERVCWVTNTLRQAPEISVRRVESST